MACDEGLVDRIRDVLRGARGIGEAAYEPALKRVHVREMDFAMRLTKGYVFVASEGLAEDEDLRKWVEVCRDFGVHSFSVQ